MKFSSFCNRKSIRVPSFHVDFSTKENSQNLNDFFLNISERGLLEGKDFKFLDMVFSFVAVYVDGVTAYQYYSPLTETFTNSTTIMKDWLYDNTSLGLKGNDCSIYQPNFSSEIKVHSTVFKTPCFCG